MRKQTGLTYYLTSFRAVKCARLNYTDAFFFLKKKKKGNLDKKLIESIYWLMFTLQNTIEKRCYIVHCTLFFFFMGIAIKLFPKNSFPFCVYDLQTSF